MSLAELALLSAWLLDALRNDVALHPQRHPDGLEMVTRITAAVRGWAAALSRQPGALRGPDA